MAEIVNTSNRDAQQQRRIALMKKRVRHVSLAIVALLILSIPPDTYIANKVQHPPTTFAVAFSPDGRMVASGSFTDDTINVWDIRTGSLLHTFSVAQDRIRVTSVAFSPDGQLVADGDGLWNVTSGRLLHDFFHEFGYQDIFVAFSHDGFSLASGSSDLSLALWADHTVKLWDVRSSSELRTF